MNHNQKLLSKLLISRNITLRTKSLMTSENLNEKNKIPHALRDHEFLLSSPNSKVVWSCFLKGFLVDCLEYQEQSQKSFSLKGCTFLLSKFR